MVATVNFPFPAYSSLANLASKLCLVHLLFQKEVQGQARLEQGGRALLVIGKGKGGLGVQVCGARGMVGALHV